MVRKSQPPSDRNDTDEPGETTLRIIGGDLRGRKVRYSGDPRTRPMKDRVREALFNLLGPGIRGSHALDLFAGTGAIGLEALSRGAARATFFETHFPSAKLIEENIAALGLESRATVLPGSSLVRFRNPTTAAASVSGDERWLAFVSPPFDFFVERTAEMLQVLATLATAAPPRSTIVIESDERFDFAQLDGEWHVRDYPPARIGICHV